MSTQKSSFSMGLNPTLKPSSCSGFPELDLARLTQACGELEACSVRLGRRLADEGAGEVRSVNLKTLLEGP